MRTQRFAGWTALVSGLLLVVGIAVSSFAPPASFGADTAVGTWTAPCAGGGMMGSGHMGGMMGSASGCTGSTAAGAAPIAGAPEVRVRVSNFAFTPNVIRLPKGGDVNLTLENPASTAVVHDFTVQALGMHVAADAGQATTVGLRGLAAGSYDAYCSVPGHADLGMRATVIVE